MTKRFSLLLWVNIAMFGSSTYAQTLFSARTMGLGAYGAMVTDACGFDVNPAGIAWIRDWDFGTATYTSTSGENAGFVFHGLSFGKRFLEDNAVAAQYTPGASLEFLLPTNLSQVTNTPVSFDKRIRYEEPFALAFARKFSDEVAAGVGVRRLEEKVTDTQYQLDPGDTTFVISFNEQTARSWRIDVGVIWKPENSLTLSAVGRSIVAVKETTLPSDFSSFRLSDASALELGAAYAITPSLRVALDLRTDKTGAVGSEWTPVGRTSVRAGLYCSTTESPFVYGVAVGLGWSYDFLVVDAGYLHFLDQGKRRGSGAVGEFDAGTITRVDLNPYTHDRLSLSVKALFGNIRENLARIESVEIFGSVYPSSYETFAYRPIGKVRVRNISDKPIQARARFYVDNLMDGPTETAPVYISPGSEEEIPFTAVFNNRVKNVSQVMVRDGDVYVSATTGDEYDDKFQTRLLFQGRNDWDGNAETLRYFVTPNDQDVIRYGREILVNEMDSLENEAKELRPFLKAQMLFNAFAGKLITVGDPKQSADYVQYPSETLKLRTGDCDDMTVTFSSLLNSIGIATAFVDVIPPGRPERSHIYLLFDTGLDPKYGGNIAENPKRYIVRKTKSGDETIWVPIETTVITKGFSATWTTGAQEYFDDVEIGLGLIKGWVRIVDVY